MQRANQSNLAQSANNELVGIRLAELNYFSSFFSNFGSQSALIAGFALTSVTSVPALKSECSRGWIYFYWATSAIAFVTAMHVVICTMLISVYGQGLALRGPLGSMVTSIEGMIIEQEHIFQAFIIAASFFGLSCLSSYWIMMSSQSAFTMSCVTVMGMGIWYEFSRRIYNRFKYSHGTAWRSDSSDSVSTFDSLQYPTKALLAQAAMDNNDGDTSQPSRYSSLSMDQNNNNTHQLGFFSFVSSIMHTLSGSGNSAAGEAEGRGRRGADDVNNPLRTPLLPAQHTSSASALLLDRHALAAERLPSAGFIGFNEVRVLSKSPHFKRFYIVLYNSCIFFYDSKVDFERSGGGGNRDDDDRRKRKRPVPLLGRHKLEVHIDSLTLLLVYDDVDDDNHGQAVSSDDNRGGGGGDVVVVKEGAVDRATGGGGGATTHPQLDTDWTDKRPLEFRCDSTSEFAGWIEMFTRALNAVHRHNDNSAATARNNRLTDKMIARHGGKQQYHM